MDPKLTFHYYNIIYIMLNRVFWNLLYRYVKHDYIRKYS